MLRTMCGVCIEYRLEVCWEYIYIYEVCVECRLRNMVRSIYGVWFICRVWFISGWSNVYLWNTSILYVHQHHALNIAFSGQLKKQRMKNSLFLYTCSVLGIHFSLAVQGLSFIMLSFAAPSWLWLSCLIVPHPGSLYG